ncbi:MAG: ATP-dependent Clp protease ATP-binding subunit [Candidatus Wildermuthbacteria bacterium]|nr:ATP-dependent Clp protease ATP-binding subunit [Candidatus Wildermuthbacteria bacterium]
MDSPFSFNLNQSQLAPALFLDALFPMRVFAAIRKILYWAFWIALALFLYGYMQNAFSETALSELLGYSLLSFSGFSALFVLELFFAKLKDAKPAPSSRNLADFLTFETARAVKESLRLAKKKHVKEPNSAMLLYSLLRKSSDLDFVFARLLMDKRGIARELKKILDQETIRDSGFLEILSSALQFAKSNGSSSIQEGDLLAALSERDPFFKDACFRSQISAKDVQNVGLWLIFLQGEIQERKKFWLPKNLRKRGTLAKNWTAGYTATLDAFSYDLTQIAKQSGFPRIVGHKKEVESAERVLAGSQNNNVLLVGEPGSGSTSIVLEIAARCLLGESLPEINYKRVLQLDLSSVLARVSDFRMREETLSKIFSEVVNAGNVILVINELHNFVRSEAQDKPGTLDITGILSPFLRGLEFPIVALTTFSGLHRSIEQNLALASLFEKVEVAEISEEEAMLLLERRVPGYEKKYKRFIPYQALKSVLSFSQRYIQAIPLPKKALDLLEESMTYLTQSKEKVLLPSHVAKVVEEKTQIPVGEVEVREKEILLNMEDLIHARIVDQEEAVREVSSALRRARTQVASRSGPMGGFLFLGPTGVGKTETAKALAAVYFGSESRMIRLDMSEFQNLQDIERLLGSPEQDGLLTTPVQENPFSLILLDEIEKAHPKILNLFLQVLDEGNITDGIGRKVSFQHSIIIATSNAGYQLILQAIKDHADFAELKETMRDYLFKEGIFKPELLNRFDSVVIFKPLEKEHLVMIAQLMLSKLKKGLKEKGIEFQITEELKEKMAELGYDPIFGARPMKRAIQDHVENLFATALLKGEVKAGDKVEITKDFQIKHL